MISGAVYELSKSYDQAFIVIGGVYFVDALVFAAAALLHTLRLQRRRLSTTATTADNFDSSRIGARRQHGSTDFHLTDVNCTPIMAVPPLFSSYGAVVAGATGQAVHVGQDGKSGVVGKRRDQSGTTSAPSGVHDAE